MDYEVYPRQLIEAVAKYRDPNLKIQEFYDPVAKINRPPEERGEPSQNTIKPTFSDVLIKIMNDKKYDLNAFFRKLIISHEGNINQEGIEIDILKTAATKTFGKILTKEEIIVFTDGLDQDNNSEVDLKEMITTLRDGMNDPLDKLKVYFNFLAIILDKTKQPTGRIFLL